MPVVLASTTQREVMPSTKVREHVPPSITGVTHKVNATSVRRDIPLPWTASQSTLSCPGGRLQKMSLLRETAALFPGLKWIIIGGSPCQDFTFAGFMHGLIGQVGSRSILSCRLQSSKLCGLEDCWQKTSDQDAKELTFTTIRNICGNSFCLDFVSAWQQ